VRVGAYSVFEEVRGPLRQALVDCHSADAVSELDEEEDGVFSVMTSRAIRALVSCPGFEQLKVDKAARGALTPSVWVALLGKAAMPGLNDKLEALTLTFEATDFGHAPEWNFCRDSANRMAIADAAGTNSPVCRNSSDPCSLLTWGPRGATAGQGRELQWILGNVSKRDESIVREAFGDEYDNVSRFLKLIPPPMDTCHGTSPLEFFMCAVWVDPRRRKIWDDALTQLGRHQSVRKTYNQVYALEQFDGYKINSYVDLWGLAGLDPTEVDLAFFHDRATHIGAAPDSVALLPSFSNCIATQGKAANRNAAARRCLALLHRHPTASQDRLARDVAFYVDAFPNGGLSAEEIRDWNHHIPITAAGTFGLSDTHIVNLAEVLSKGASDIEAPSFQSDELTKAERNCPAGIRQPDRTPAAVRGD
jgi:hypothetical protein